MEKNMINPFGSSSLGRMIVILSSLLAVGCASVSSWQTETAPDDFVDGTHILAEVVLIATREQALTAGGLMEGWRDKLVDVGYSEDDIVDGSEVLGREYFTQVVRREQVTLVFCALFAGVFNPYFVERIELYVVSTACIGE